GFVCSAIRAACRASALSASCRAERRTRTTASTRLTPTAVRIESAIAANSRAWSDFTDSRRHGLVAGAADRPDQPRPAQLAPELGDVDVDRPRSACVIHSPNPFKQHVT